VPTLHATHGRSIIQEEIKLRVINETSSHKLPQQPSTEPTEKERHNLLGYLQKPDTLMKSTPVNEAIHHHQEYFAAEFKAEITDPIKYWENYKFAPLAKVAIKYLFPPATSCASERLFSKSGQLISARRINLKPKNVNMLLFLNSNKELFFFLIF
jgi:hypothetical protein